MIYGLKGDGEYLVEFGESLAISVPARRACSNTFKGEWPTGCSFRTWI
jgi:hypothetical protein